MQKWNVRNAEADARQNFLRLFSTNLVFILVKLINFAQTSFLKTLKWMSWHI